VTELSEWFSAIGTIAASVVAIIIAFLPSIRRWYNRPEFSIEFENKEPFCRCTNLVSGEKAYWIRLRVKNVGRSIARGCEGKLVRVTDANMKKGRKDFDPVALRWASTQRYEPIAINKTEYEYLDLVMRKTNDKRVVHIVADATLLRGINLDPPLTDYIFHIIIYGENVEPLEKSYYYKTHLLYDKDELSEYKA